MVFESTLQYDGVTYIVCEEYQTVGMCSVARPGPTNVVGPGRARLWLETVLEQFRNNFGTMKIGIVKISNFLELSKLLNVSTKANIHVCEYFM